MKFGRFVFGDFHVSLCEYVVYIYSIITIDCGSMVGFCPMTRKLFMRHIIIEESQLTSVFDMLS